MDIVKTFEKEGIACRAHEPMRLHTSFKTGGPAEIFLLPDSAAKLAKAVEICRVENKKYYVIGKGSNLLVSDEGVRGIVISTEAMNKVTEDNGCLSADAGAGLTLLAIKALEAGMGGFEFAYGIPGSVGGAVVMNAGAYGGEIKDILKSVTVLDPGGNILTLDPSELDLSYRHSNIEEKGYIVLSALFAGEKAYPAAVKQKMDENMAARKAKQPLEYPSAGSTFKRPEGHFAGRLIEDAGLKGFGVGGAQVSEKHAGFVINKGSATTSDIEKLIGIIKEKVYANSRVELECEVKRLGSAENK
ncbi:MAG: UDP-N-acetylmuramate dehydrogenase [Lachnospiraceae bacterium]|nr:UDP-N-acetylmuramate dehydrogenase [Lachnospiraceae bacterium]